MDDWRTTAYLWVKWVHILAVISWMAGILYLYRLLINHKERGSQSADNHKLLIGMEYRLSRYITFPAMWVSVFAGFGMVFLSQGMIYSVWLWLKVAMVVGLMGMTFYADRLRIRAATDLGNLLSARTLRFLNEGPTLLMAVIVWLVLFKPW